MDIHPTATIPRGTRIPENIVIEENVEVLPNTKLTEHTIIQKNSVLSARIPRYSIAKGDPAQVIAFFLPEREFNPDVSDKHLSISTLHVLIKHFDFKTVLDIGSGAGWHAEKLERAGKKVTKVDFGTSCYYEENFSNKNTVLGDYLDVTFDEPFDCIWASHILEHQPDVHSFLLKIHRELKEEGILAVTVPPSKDNIVGGHINLFNMGLLLYRLVLAGFDCSKAHCIRYGYNLSIIVRKNSIKLPSLNYDSGDIEKLAQYFPFEPTEGFDGNIDMLNWPWLD